MTPMTIHRTRPLVWLFGCAATLAAPTALAQSSAPGWWFQLGGFRPSIDSSLRRFLSVSSFLRKVWANALSLRCAESSRHGSTTRVSRLSEASSTASWQW